LGIAAVMAGTATVMLVLGFAFSPLLLVVAVPFAGAAYLMWQDATGRIDFRRVSAAVDARNLAGDRAGRRRRRAARNRRRAYRPPAASDDRPPRREAYETLGLDPGADEAAVERAYRERVKEVHPDADGGSEEAFKRVNRAYEALVDEP